MNLVLFEKPFLPPELSLKVAELVHEALVGIAEFVESLFHNKNLFQKESQMFKNWRLFKFIFYLLLD